MTDESEKEAVPAAESIKDYPNLYARQDGVHTWRVLHLEDGEANRAYEVDTHNLSCTCEDMQMNRDEGEVCKHLAVALFNSQTTLTVEELATRDLAYWIQEAKEVVGRVERHATGLEADVEAAEAEGADETDDEAPESGEYSDLDKVIQWLDRQGVPIEDVKVWEHDDYGSIQIQADEMDDDEFDEFLDLMQGTDAISWDKNNGVNYIPEDQVEEVVG